MEPQLTGYVLLKHEKFLPYFIVFHVSNVLNFRHCKNSSNNCNRENLIFKSKLCFGGTRPSDDDQILSGCILNGLWERKI